MTVPPIALTATDLEIWAGRREAQDQLPRVVRELIFAAGPPPELIAMVSGEAVQRGGWDGILKSQGASPYVPAGTSGWEMSVRKDIARKATEDFRKRSEDPLGLNPAEVTFVFVTARSWHDQDKAAWRNARVAESIWQDAKVIDGHDLETWLATAPSVQLRLAYDLGKRPPGVADLMSTWLEYSASTRPHLSKNLVLSGRGEAAAEIGSRLEGDGEVVSIAADSRDEALAFLFASLDRLPADQRDTLMSRAIVVWDPSHWAALTSRDEPLLLIPMFDERSIAVAAVRSGHRVVIPLGREEGRNSATAVQVGRPRRDDMREELQRLGLPRPRAQDLAGIGRRSFRSLKRQLSPAPDAERPDWSKPEYAADLVPALFAGSWVDSSEKDRHALEQMARTKYSEWSRIVRRWEGDSDPPVRLVDEVWLLASKEDAWPLLLSAISLDDLESFRETCVETFSWIDPKHDFPIDRQWLAGLSLDTDPSVSGILRKGLADTLALLGTRDDQLSGGTGQEWAARIVRDILERADDDWRLWATIAHVLPLLAEAAPEQFMDAVDRGCRGDDPLIPKLFRDQTTSLFGSSPHVELLWAFERLAWSPEHLSRASLALARLTRIEPGGTAGNLPFTSLRSIFSLAASGTAANGERMRETLALLIAREPEVGWKLLTELVTPSRGGDLTSRPDRREWAPEPHPQASFSEVANRIEEIVDLLLDHVGANDRRWADLVPLLAQLPRSSFNRVMSELEALKGDQLEAETRRALLDAIRMIVSKHRTFPDAIWSIPKEQVDRLRALYDELEPDDLIEQNRWLFCERPALIDDPPRDWRVRNETLETLRLAAVRQIYAVHGLAGITGVATGSTWPTSLGLTLGQEEVLTTSDMYELLTQGLGANDEIGHVARGLARAIGNRKSPDWLREVLESKSAQSWTDDQKAEFLLAPWYTREAWELAEEAGGDVPSRYWANAQLLGLKDYELAAEAAEKLLEHDRPYSAMVLLAEAVGDVDDPPSWDLILRTLETAPKTDPRSDPTESLQYYVEQLLDRITKSGDVADEMLARIEWTWLPLLEETSRSAEVLHRELARNPEFFVELLGFMYSDTDENPDTEDQAQGDLDDEGPSQEDQEAQAEDPRAAHAQMLLRSWRALPGMRADGTVDDAELKAWVSKVLEQTGEGLSPMVTEYELGQILAWSPPGDDGHWPHPAVREVIERLESDTLERSLHSGRFNSRGITTRLPLDGGNQERSLAGHYEQAANALAGRYIRTARVLRRLATTYRRMAQQEDASSELWEDLMG